MGVDAGFSPLLVCAGTTLIFRSFDASAFDTAAQMTAATISVVASMKCFPQFIDASDGSCGANVTMKTVRAGRIAALCAVILIGASAFEPFYLRIFVIDRQQYGSMLTELPYRKLPGLRAFLDGVRTRTRRGDSVALFAIGLHHAAGWAGGYDYFRERAMYPLAGRRIVALIDDNDRFHSERVNEANCIAAYRSSPSAIGFALVWRGADGTLLRRVR